MNKLKNYVFTRKDTKTAQKLIKKFIAAPYDCEHYPEEKLKDFPNKNDILPYCGWDNELKIIGEKAFVLNVFIRKATSLSIYEKNGFCRIILF